MTRAILHHNVLIPPPPPPHPTPRPFSLFAPHSMQRELGTVVITTTPQASSKKNTSVAVGLVVGMVLLALALVVITGGIIYTYRLRKPRSVEEILEQIKKVRPLHSLLSQPLLKHLSLFLVALTLCPVGLVVGFSPSRWSLSRAASYTYRLRKPRSVEEILEQIKKARPILLLSPSRFAE